MRKPIAGSTYVVNRNVGYPDDLSVSTTKWQVITNIVANGPTVSVTVNTLIDDLQKELFPALSMIRARAPT